MTALAALSVPGIAAAKSSAYDPKARFDIKVSEAPFRRSEHGRQLMARIYQPLSSTAGAGPFPTLLDLHGGAWTRKDRFANEPMDRAVAAGRAQEEREPDQGEQDLLQSVGIDQRGQSAADPRAPRSRDAAAAAHHAGRARRQRAARGAGEIRRDLPCRGRRLPVPRLREVRARVGRRARTADRPRPPHGQAIHRPTARALTPVSV